MPLLHKWEKSHNFAMDMSKSEIEFIPSEFTKRLRLTFAPAIKAGFPSPAEAYEVEALDFNKDMIEHPDTTFYGRVRGDSMIDAGITDGDIIVIDRSVEPQNGDIVVAFFNREYTIKYYDCTHKAEGYVELVPANRKYPVFKVTESDDFMIWGVVVFSIKNTRPNTTHTHSLTPSRNGSGD